MQIIRWFGLAVLLVLVGCQSQRLALGNEEEVRASSNEALIAAYVDTASPQLKAELERRGTFTPQEWQMISERAIHKGMREEVVWVSRGRPWRENEQVDAFGKSKQLCYNVDSNGIPKMYIYIQNGRVSGWQRFDQ